MIANVIAAHHYPADRLQGHRIQSLNGTLKRPDMGRMFLGLDKISEHQSSGKLQMTAVKPPEMSVVNSVTVISPGTDFSNLYESLIDQLGMSPQFLEELNPPKLLIDMKHVKFVGSAFLGRMVFVHKTLTARESGRVAMCGLNSFCRAALSVSKLDSVLEVFPTVEVGLSALDS